MPQCQLADANGEDGRDDVRPLAKLYDRDGKVIVRGILAEDCRYVARALSLKGLESSPTLIQAFGIYLKITRGAGRRLSAGAWSRGRPGTAGSAETERRARMCSAHGGILAKCLPRHVGDRLRCSCGSSSFRRKDERRPRSEPTATPHYTAERYRQIPRLESIDFLRVLRVITSHRHLSVQPILNAANNQKTGGRFGAIAQ